VEQVRSASSRLLHRSLLTAPIGQQTDLFGTDLGSTQPPEQAARRSIGPGAAGQHGRFLQGLADRSSFQLAEQARGWTPATHTPLTAKAPTWHLYPPEDGRDHPARRSFQATLLLATMGTGRGLVFPLPDSLFQRFSHSLLPCFLDLLFHLS
jgi:hypothetical protein